MKRLYLVLVGLVLLVAFAGAGLASGHFLITSIHQIKPSVVRRLTGPQGPIGPQGAPGPQGAIGPQGVSGTLAATFVVSSGAAVPYGVAYDFYPTCPAGTVLTGGGFRSLGRVLTSEPTGSTWHVTIRNDVSGNPIGGTAYAVCGRP